MPKIRMTLPFVIVALLVGAAFERSAVGASSSDPLTLFEGLPLILEFPTLEDVGSLLEVPDGWRWWQVDAAWIQTLRKRFDVQQLPTVLYLDEFGNELQRDVGSSSRRRVGVKIREFSRRQKQIVDRFEKLWEEALEARTKGRRDAEVNKLNQIRERNLHGYLQVERARKRLQELDTLAQHRLLRTLAWEGTIPPRRFLRLLEQLRPECKGLPVSQVLEHELARLDVLRVTPRD